MPKFRALVSLKLSATEAVAPGAIVEMSESDALSLPAGTVEAVKAAPPAPVAPTPVPAAPKAAKEKKS